MRLPAGLAFLLAACAASCVLAQQGANPPDCYQYSGCSQCTAAPSGLCGWDPVNSACKSGTSSGPSDRIGWSGEWTWEATECCAQFTNQGCSSCVWSGAGNCGWNVASSVCQEGNFNGPYSDTYDSSYWVAPNNEGSVCPDTCSDYSDCESCTGTSGCGWTSGICVGGNTFGPYLGGYSSTWYYDSCPSSWSLRWSVNSLPLWGIFCGGFGFLAFIFFVYIGRRRRRMMMQRNADAATNSNWTTTQQQQPTVASPLLANGGYSSVPVTGAPVWGGYATTGAPQQAPQPRGKIPPPPAAEIEVYAPVVEDADTVN